MTTTMAPMILRIGYLLHTSRTAPKAGCMPAESLHNKVAFSCVKGSQKCAVFLFTLLTDPSLARPVRYGTANMNTQRMKHAKSRVLR